jgi:tRNA-dihydrouridine synthase B
MIVQKDSAKMGEFEVHNHAMTKSTLLEHLKLNPFVLAPMAGITDCGFRSFMRDLGCGIVVTELVSATGLKHGSDRTVQLMKFRKNQHPIGVQIFGENLEDLAYAAKFIEDSGADFVDLNFGCPVTKVVKRGAGAAILKDPLQVRAVFKSVKSATQLPVTVKIRTGWDDTSRNSLEVCKIAHEEGLTWVAIHGRTRAQGYSGLSDWEYIKHIAEESPLPIIGNGDITTAEKAKLRLTEAKVAGVMIGRGALKNPWIFSEARGVSIPQETRLTLLLVKLREHLLSDLDERRALLTIKKFCGWFSAGYPASSQFRRELFQISDQNELLQKVETYFGHMQTVMQADTSHEEFLMGGHG